MSARAAVFAGAAAVLIAACGGSATTSTAGGNGGTTASTSPPAATTTTAATSDETTTTIVIEDCMEPATEVPFGEANDLEIPDGESRVYLCVQVPIGVTTLRIEVPDPDGELTLYAGYPHLENVQNGGFEGLEFWQAAEEDGSLVIAMEPLIHRGGLLEEDTQDEFIRPGSYYVEVGGPAGAGFTLTVSEA